MLAIRWITNLKFISLYLFCSNDWESSGYVCVFVFVYVCEWVWVSDEPGQCLWVDLFRLALVDSKEFVYHAAQCDEISSSLCLSWFIPKADKPSKIPALNQCNDSEWFSVDSVDNWFSDFVLIFFASTWMPLTKRIHPAHELLHCPDC